MIDADISGLLAQFKAINERASCVYEKLKDMPIPQLGITYVSRSTDYGSAVEAITERYNSAITDFESIKKDIGSTTNLSILSLPLHGGVDERIKTMTEIEIETKKAIGVLESVLRKITIPLTKWQIDKLESLRQELDKMKVDVNYERNLNNAIDEYERWHHLASSLIASRVIVYCLSKISGKEDKEKIQFLVDKNVIDKTRKDTVTDILKASRQARNFLSHDIGVFPSPAEALVLLSEAVRIVELLTKLHAHKEVKTWVN